MTSYGDLASFAQQQSRASAFILSIDDEEFGAGSPEEAAATVLANLRAFVEEIRFRNSEIPDVPARRDAHLAAHPERHPARS